MRTRTALVLAAAAVVGVVLDATVPAVNDWLYLHSFTNGMLVGAILVAATYLVVERVMEERDARRWRHAARPLLRAIAAAGAGTDREVRRAAAGDGGGTEQCDWLDRLLERYQPALSGTPELVDHWHAGLSLAAHARAVHEAVPPALDAGYERAWERFERCFAEVAVPSDSGGEPAPV